MRWGEGRCAADRAAAAGRAAFLLAITPILSGGASDTSAHASTTRHTTLSAKAKRFSPTSMPPATPAPTTTPTTTPAPTPTPTPAVTATLTSAPTPTRVPTPTPTANSASTPVAHFGTLQPHASLPTGAQCAQWIAASTWEPRPENGVANRTKPAAARLLSFYAQPLFSDSTPASDFATVDGNYTGTTDMILRSEACKWGIDEDILRAQAANESNWTQSSNGDLRTDASQCSAGNWNGWNGSYCYQSYGITQIKVFDYNTWPEAWTSTPFNVDFRGAYQRACMNGDISYLASETPSPGYPTYPNGTTDQMLWGCIGQWFSGDWYDSGAIQYISDVQNLLASKPWLGWPSATGSYLSITSPANGATVKGIVPIVVDLSSSVSWIEFCQDGSYLTSSPPNTYNWDTTNFVINGTHSIGVDAHDSSGTVIDDAFVNLNVSN